MELIRRIGLIYALDFEFEPLRSKLTFAPESLSDASLPFKAWRARIAEAEIFALVAGVDERYQAENIGTNAATLGAYALIEAFRPDILLNPGTAGGFQSKGARIGDVYLGHRDVRFHDRRTTVKRFHQSFVGYYPVVEAPRLQATLGLKAGIVSSGNSFDCPPVDLERLQANDAVLKEMEAAAIGWVAWLKGVPLLPIKAVTDYVEEAETAEAQFVANYKTASANLSDVVEKAIAFLAGRKLQEI